VVVCNGCMQKLRVPKIRAKCEQQHKDKGKSDLHKLLNKEMAIVVCKTYRKGISLLQ